AIDCNNTTGTIIVSGTEGVAPYQFALGSNDFQNSNHFEGLSVGSYELFIKDANGCINQTNANVEAKLRTDRQRITQYSCDENEIGIDTMFFFNEFGCDSLIITITLDARTPSIILTENTCNRSQTKPDTLFLQNQFGCDSLIITAYNLVASDTTFLSGTTCDAAAAGERTLNLTNQFGCDSIVVINTTFSDKDVLFIDRLTCDPTLIGIDTASFINQLGCDSLIITTTTLQGISDTTKLRIETCDFNSIGLDTLFLSNQSGCDSLVITERFFAFPSPPIIEFSSESPVCQGDTILLSTNSYDSGLQWIKNGAEIDGAISTQLVVTEAGTYGLSYTNEEGCAVVASTVTFSFLEAPEVPIFTNENNLLSLENLEVFENLDFLRRTTVNLNS
ncbi:MAG: hypothetical protein AAFO82_23085, partial [Bacteroidota bacterium]